MNTSTTLTKPTKSWEELNKVIKNQSTQLRDLDQYLKKQSEDIKLIRTLAEKKNSFISSTSNHKPIITSECIVLQTQWMSCSSDNDQGEPIRMLIGPSLNFIKAEGRTLTPLNEINLDEATNFSTKVTPQSLQNYGRSTSKLNVSKNHDLQKTGTSNQQTNNFSNTPKQDIKNLTSKYIPTNFLMSSMPPLSKSEKAATDCPYCHKNFANSELGLHIKNCAIRN